MKKLNILYIAAESRPFVTVGGLGEVAYSLVRAISQLTQKETDPYDVDIRLALPFHAAIHRDNLDMESIASFDIPSNKGLVKATAYEVRVDGITVYLIQGSPIPTEPGPIYAMDAALDGHKYVFFSIAALELAKTIGWQPHILHANDWHTAPAVYYVYLKRKQDQFYSNIKTLLTIHNLPYLGSGAGQAMNDYGLPAAENSPLPFWAQNLPLPVGLLTADHIVAVSPGYASEILTPAYGSGLHEFLKTRQDTISGILNGIDTDYWNPEIDPTITFNYSVSQVEPREGNKTWLQKKFKLEEEPRNPIMAVVSRLDYQKGIDLVLDALMNLADLRWQVIILGTGTPDLEDAARRLERVYPDRVRAVIAYDKELSRHIYDGADIFLIPSRYEPCGLVQMIAMRYGCVPVARATGGLKDTIVDCMHLAECTGFLFEEATALDLEKAIRRALAAYKQKRIWKKIQKFCMERDFSWQQSALKYFNLYTILHNNNSNDKNNDIR